MISAAIRLTGDLPKHEEINGNQVNTEGPLLACAKSLIGVLVVMPGHPDKGKFFFFFFFFSLSLSLSSFSLCLLITHFFFLRSLLPPERTFDCYGRA